MCLIVLPSNFCFVFLSQKFDNICRGQANGGYAYPVVPSSGYGSYNPYSTADRRQFQRDGLYHYDPYRRQEYTGNGGNGGSGIEDKWRHTYPYVPTSYYYHSPPPRPPPESIGDILIKAGIMQTFC